eukprot:1434751-Rhodomonas_salina.1
MALCARYVMSGTDFSAMVLQLGIVRFHPRALTPSLIEVLRPLPSYAFPGTGACYVLQPYAPAIHCLVLTKVTSRPICGVRYRLLTLAMPLRVFDLDSAATQYCPRLSCYEAELFSAGNVLSELSTGSTPYVRPLPVLLARAFRTSWRSRAVQTHPSSTTAQCLTVSRSTNVESLTASN